VPENTLVTSSDVERTHCGHMEASSGVYFYYYYLGGGGDFSIKSERLGDSVFWCFYFGRVAMGRPPVLDVDVVCKY